MKFGENPLKKLSLLKATGYIFAIALCAKGVGLYATSHPLKEELIPIEGIVEKVRLGGDGRATSLHIESDKGLHKCSSYYGTVWRGMEHIKPGDSVSVLIERNKLNRDELITGKKYYLWELIHQDHVIVAYEDVQAMVQAKEAIITQYINGSVILGGLLLVAGFLRTMVVRNRESRH